MTDIFNNNTLIGSVWKADGAVIQLENSECLTISGLRMAFSRALARQTPLNTDRENIMVGKGQGTLDIQTLLGPSQNVKAFLEQYANACNIARNVMTIVPGGITSCTDSAGQTTTSSNGFGLAFILEGLLMGGIGLDVQSAAATEIVRVNCPLNFIFLSFRLG